MALLNQGAAWVNWKNLRLISGATGNKNPILKNKIIFTIAADHGVTEEGVSAFPARSLRRWFITFIRRRGINVLANHVGARVVIVDAGVACDLTPHKNFRIKKINYGTRNFAKGPAMTRGEAIKCIITGIDIFKEEYRKGIDIIGTGEMGIGNTTASSAIAAVFTKEPVASITGRGTGIDEKGFKNKIKVIEKALKINKPKSADAIDVLTKVGGFEIGVLCGIMLAAEQKGAGCD